MSVIGYERREVIEALASAWTRGSIGSSDNLRYMERMAFFGDALLEANAKAYAHTYNESIEREAPITVYEIKRGIVAKTVDSQRKGLDTLRGFRYNLIANDGTDFATVDILDWLLSLFMGLHDRGRN